MFSAIYTRILLHGLWNYVEVFAQKYLELIDKTNNSHFYPPNTRLGRKGVYTPLFSENYSIYIIILYIYKRILPHNSTKHVELFEPRMNSFSYLGGNSSRIVLL